VLRTVLYIKLDKEADMALKHQPTNNRKPHDESLQLIGLSIKHGQYLFIDIA